MICSLQGEESRDSTTLLLSFVLGVCLCVCSPITWKYYNERQSKER